MTKAAELAKMGEVLTNSQIGGRRNIIINGAMQVAQRATSVAWSANGYLTVDRFQAVNNNTAGRFTMKQSAITDLPGFANALELDVTTADTSIAAGEVTTLQYKIEGQDLQQLKKGTSSAEKVTLSFYVKANAARVVVAELMDGDNTRKIQQKFTTTTGWTRHILTFAADTTGALDDDNAESLQLQLWLHAGSTYTGGTFTSNTWAATTTANRAAGIDSLYTSTDNNFFITGIQLEVGEQATPFEHRSFGEELALCQRYHYRAGKAESAYTNFGQGWATAARAGTIQIPLPVEMRAEPSVTINDVQVSDDANAAVDCSAIAVNAATGGRQLAVLEFTVGSDVTQYRSYGLRGSNNTASHVSLSAEL